MVDLRVKCQLANLCEGPQNFYSNKIIHMLYVSTNTLIFKGSTKRVKINNVSDLKNNWTDVKFRIFIDLLLILSIIKLLP